MKDDILKQVEMRNTLHLTMKKYFFRENHIRINKSSIPEKIKYKPLHFTTKYYFKNSCLTFSSNYST